MSNILTNKTYKQYSYICRYAGVPSYFNTEDNRNIMGLTAHLSKENSYVLHTVVRNETFDSISLTYYNSPLYYWVIMDFNDLKDPFIKLEPGMKLRIPTLSNISYSEV